LIRQVEDHMIVLSDTAFHATEGDPTNLKLCHRGEWEDRMLVETVLSMLTLVTHFKKVRHRGWAYFQARLAFTPTVSFGITYAVVCTYGYDDGRIWRTRCAVIAAAPVDRESRCRACRIPPGAAGSAHTALAAASRPVSPADPGGFPRSRTTPRSGTTPC